MNDNAEPLEEDVQTEDVLDGTLVMSDIRTVPVSIAENILTASDSPKHSLPNNKTKSKKLKLRESVETSETSEKLSETIHGGDAEDIFGAYLGNEL